MDPSIQRAFEAARMAEANSRIDDAVQIYDYVVQTFPDTADAHYARTELERLRSAPTTTHAAPSGLSAGANATNGTYKTNAIPPFQVPRGTPLIEPLKDRLAKVEIPSQPTPTSNTASTIAEAVEHAQYKARVFPEKKKYKSGYGISRVVLIFGVVAVLLSIILGTFLNQLARTDSDILIGIASVAALFFGGTVMILLGLVSRAIFDTANVNRRVAELLDVHTSD